MVFERTKSTGKEPDKSHFPRFIGENFKIYYVEQFRVNKIICFLRLNASVFPYFTKE